MKEVNKLGTFGELPGGSQCTIRVIDQKGDPRQLLRERGDLGEHMRVVKFSTAVRVIGSNQDANAIEISTGQPVCVEKNTPNERMQDIMIPATALAEIGVGA